MNIVLLIFFTILCITALILAAGGGRLRECFCGDGEALASGCGSRMTEFLRRHERKIAALLLICGVVIRVFCFWLVPDGLNQDEASVSYDAYADITYGMDRNGDHNPVYSVAWGSGHSSLYITLSKPWIALFGLNLFTARVTNVLFGCLALFAFWGILRRMCRPLSCIGLFFLVICPWHIMMCRWGLECNLFPNIFLLALYFLVRGTEQPRFYPVSLFLFGLSLYAYGTSYMVVPVFLLLCAVYLVRRKKITWKMLLLSSAVFVVAAFPIGIFMVINTFGLPELRLGFLTFPRLVSGRYHTTVTVLGGDFFKTVGKNLATLFKIIFLQTDGLIWNAVPKFGTLYLFSAPFLLLGVIRIVCRSLRRGYHAETFAAFLLIAAVVLGAMSDLNINRANFIFLPLLIALTEGVLVVLAAAKRLVYAVFPVYICAFFLFCGVYFTSYRAQVGRAFFYGAGEAIVYASDQTEGTVYLSDKINAPYIIAMFYEKTDPRIFIDTVDYVNPDSECRFVRSFDRYVTGIPDEAERREGAAYVLDVTEKDLFDSEKYDLKAFGYYYAATEKQR